jgi:regulator of sigma E protease
LVTILIFLAILGLLLFVHELGHFITAKLSHVQVDEFAFGFPPRLVSKQRGETRYSINAIPLGGYCKMLGEEDPSQPKSFASKRARTRLLILCAGSLMNALLPLLLFSVAFMIPQHVDVGDVTVMEVAQGSPAADAGLQQGDIIRSFNGHKITNGGDLLYQIQLNLGSSVNMVVERGGELRTVSLVPRWKPPEGQGPTGISTDLKNVSQTSESYAPWKAVPKAFTTYKETVQLFKNEVESWFKGRHPEVSGPVGIADLTGQVAKGGPSPLFSFTAILSINLAIVNMLPIPGLDGGRIFFVLLEKLRGGKRISPQKEGMVHLIGFVILILFIVMISYFDITRIVSG